MYAFEQPAARRDLHPKVNGFRDNTFHGCWFLLTVPMSPVPAGDEEVTVELFVRSLSPRDSRQRIESIVRQLDALVATGTVARYRVVPTGAELPARRADAVTDIGGALLDRVTVFREWARATGRSIDATFERRTISSRITGEDHDALVLPTVALAEYVGEDLRFVAPCVDGDDHWTVTDRLEALAAGEPRHAENRLPRARTVLSVGDEATAPGTGEAVEDGDDSPTGGPGDWPTPGTGQ